MRFMNSLSSYFVYLNNLDNVVRQYGNKLFPNQTNNFSSHP